ncbi:MAG: prohibitin family protein [Anaerolineae bacterium]|nr:prohibitin family protein [Anaerolineae bacterium]
MEIKALLGFLIAIFVLGGIGGGIALAAMNTARGRKARPGIILLVIGILGMIVLMPLNAGLVLVQPNEVGVVFNQIGRGDDALLTPLSTGLSWVVPFRDQVEIYDASQQSVTMATATESGQAGHAAVSAVTKDGQTISVDVTVIYSINRARVNDIHRNWRNNYQDGFIVAQARSEVRNATSLYSAEEIYSGGRAALESGIVDNLSEAYATQGFLLTDVLIRDISFSPEFKDAIEQKQIAQQQAEQAKFRVQQAQQEAEKARVDAQGRADSAVIAAQGEAESITIKAQAESEALKLINSVLSQNPNLLQWQYINQLSDQVQLIIIPSNSPFLFNLEDLMAQAGVQPAPVQPSPTQEPDQQ